MKIRLGIFDSGVGGLTVLNSLLKTRKEVDVLYLADTKRCPYGEKKPEEIKGFALEICNWFKEKNLDALLIACNTTNSCALEILKKNLKIPCFDLINSVSEVVMTNRIGILATKATIKSSYYKNILKFKNNNINVFQQACPDFVPEIEKTKLDFQKINELAEVYLNSLLVNNIHEIILGCSHYPLIYDILREKVPKKIKIIDPSVALINKLNESVIAMKLFLTIM